MIFSSMVFLYLFLPIVLLFYLVTKKELHNPILLIASIIFYAWGEPKYLAIMLITIIINYIAAIFIEKFRHSKKVILITTVCANLAFLLYFKYFNFILENFNHLFHLNIHPVNIIMPIGISFYTFQALSYIIDVYKNEVKATKNIYKLALYICLFPQLIAGPIVKYHDIAEQIVSREVNFDKVNIGVKRFIIGLAKKVLMANTMGIIVDKIFIQEPNTFSHFIAWLGSIAYTFQLYFDFCGYSDMAIGLGLIFGFKFMENFNYPYISKSITEFWRRWHISLSTWFKQYVYIPLGGNKYSKLKTIRNLIFVFILTGIWHGAKWTFIIWGLWHGFFIILEKILNIKEYDKKTHSIIVNILRHIYCILIFVIGWVIFRAENFNYAYIYILNMFGLSKTYLIEPVYEFGYYVDKIEIIAFIACIICSTPLFKNILQYKNKFTKIFVNIYILLLFILSSVTIASNTYNPFIYFRF